MVSLTYNGVDAIAGLESPRLGVFHCFKLTARKQELDKDRYCTLLQTGNPENVHTDGICLPQP